MKNATRPLTRLLVFCLLPATAHQAVGQTGLPERQRHDYSEVFQAAPALVKSKPIAAALGSPTKALQPNKRKLVTTGGNSVQPEVKHRTSDNTAVAIKKDAGEVPGPSPQQKAAYARVFQGLIAAQEQRTAVPANLSEIPQYAKSLRAAMAAVPDDIAGLKYLLAWNHVALDATAQDHSTLSGAFGEQFGPARTSRALAIVHLAMFEAVNAISRKHPSYKNLQAAIFEKAAITPGQVTPDTTSIDRAIVEAGYRTLVKLYPQKQTSLLDLFYGIDLTTLGDIPNGPGERPTNMVLAELIGRAAAEAVLELRAMDRSELPDLTGKDFESSNQKTWHVDPITQLPPALGGNWHRVKPFVIDSADAFRPGRGNLADVTPPDLDDPAFLESDKFITAYKEVKRLGGDPHAKISSLRWPTPTDRTGSADPNRPVPADNTNETFVGIFWGYDGTALLCAPPRLYNMIATSVATKERPIDNVEDMAQYLAFINLAMADAGIAAWDAKFHFLIPRPITYIRNVDADNTPEGKHDPRWTPLGAPVTNGTDAGRNLTPPFPAYPSGHATFGGTLFQSMTLYFRYLDPMFPDAGIPFDFVSDEYNGNNHGPGGTENRQLVIAHFESFDQARTLNAQSRIFLGIHWQFDADDGITQGMRLAEDVFQKFVQP